MPRQSTRPLSIQTTWFLLAVSVTLLIRSDFCSVLSFQVPQQRRGKNTYHNVRSSGLASSRSILCLAMNQKAADGNDDDNNGGSGNLVSSNNFASQLASAFSALDETDQYDAVLTGLCAKILDQTSLDGPQVVTALKDPMNLLDEMNTRRVRASSRSLMALVDATVTAQDAKVMSQIMSLAKKSGGVNGFGNLQSTITQLPTTATSRVRCPDGTTRTRQERLDNLPDVPTDDRGTEVTSALAVASVIGFCGTVNVLGLDDISPFTTVIWFLIVIVGLVDNFYDILKFGVSTFAKDKISDLPDELPLSIGSGKVSGTVVRGFNRLLKVDSERECECEAASFYVAYALGLPCFSFRPNALEAAVLVAESSQTGNDLDPLLSNNGIMKTLIWLMAPVAMESSKYPQLIESDPREAEGFLTRLENSYLIDREELWWLEEGPSERQDMLKWAYTEADLLLRNDKEIVTEIAQRLTGGGATVGDCVAAVEDW